MCGVNTQAIATTLEVLVPVSSDDGAEIISAVILSIVSTIRVLQQYTSEAETRTQDQVQRSNA
jgi:hypothetical protein